MGTVAGGHFVHRHCLLECAVQVDIFCLRVLIVLYFIDGIIYRKLLFKLRRHSALPPSAGLQNFPLNDN